jgi:LysR family transcriptional regulator of gallate degradation
VNPKHLRFFLAVATCGSVTQASRSLRRAQSAVTRAVGELETALGAELFERRAHGMMPTAAGELLRGRVQRALAEMDACRAAFAADHAGDSRAPIFSLSASMVRLRVFVALADLHSMAAVAASLGVSQPAVSQALREIETGLGARLFQRAPTGMLPTPLGALLALHLKRALAELRIAEDEIGSLKGVARGRVVVGALSLGRTRLLPLASARLLARFPDLTVHTEEGSFEHLAARLREGQIDFILGALRRPEQTAGLVREVVAPDRMGIMVRAGHPLACRADLSVAALAGARWVLPPNGTPTRELLEQTLAGRGLDPPKVGVETADLAVTLGVLLASDMVTAVSPHLFGREIEAGAVAILPLDLPETARDIGILRRARGIPSHAARHLMDIIRAIGEPPPMPPGATRPVPSDPPANAPPGRTGSA